MHLIYLDDARDEKLCVFSALAVPADKWRDTFNALRHFRRDIKQSDGVYVHKELHAWKFVSGRGRIAERIVPKGRRCELFRASLTLLSNQPGLSMLNAVFPKKDDELAFERLANRVQRMMEVAGSHAMLICDEGKEAAYTKLMRRLAVHNPIQSQFGRWQDGNAYKNIPTDRVLEDPVFKKSERSYFIQWVDFCAYALLRRENPVPSKTEYGLHEAFNILSRSSILNRHATRKDPEGILRP
jgi:hypothetical protein